MIFLAYFRWKHNPLYRGNFSEPINLFQTDTIFATPQQLTRVNPHQDSLRWGSVELVKWTGTNGVLLEGLLYKPEGFSATQKYPMLTYFYERSAETLSDYKTSAPSRSTINIPYCVSNGYQGIEMFTALRRLQKPVWMVVYNGEDHNLVQRHNAKDFGIRMYQFFDHYLKDTPMPLWMKEGRTAVEKDRGEMKY